MIAASPLADDRLERDVVQEVDVPERLARRGIGEMDLHERPLDREQRIAQGDARVGQATGVDDRDVEVARVQSIDEGALVVRLEEVDGQAQLPGPCRDPGMDLVERLVAVDLGLAGPHEVEVRTLEDEDAGHVALPAASIEPAAAATTSSAMSAWTSTPSAVGRTQRRRPPVCFLSVARWPSTSSRA